MAEGGGLDAVAGLQVRNLRKSYKKRLVIRDVSLTLGRGEVVALLGPNGCGKTTTMKMLTGVLKPSGGHALLFGHAVDTQDFESSK